MGIKRIISNTIGVSIGAVGISQANTIPTYGPAIGAAMGGGMVLEVADYKKKRRGR